MMQEYIVTVKKGVNIDELYNLLESDVCDEFIPERCIKCINRRPISRNTHYLLTEEEAELIQKDPRVEAVSLPLSKLGYKIKPAYQQTASFDKSDFANSASTNWGIYDALTESSSLPSTWGRNLDPVVEATTRDYYPLGENVDIIISDSGIWFGSVDLTEFEDGTGDERFVPLDWSQLNSFVTSLGDLDGQKLEVFSAYQPIDFQTSHGTLCATIAAGSRHGLAKKANIYHLPYDAPSFGYYQMEISGNLLRFISTPPTLTSPYGYIVDVRVLPFGSVQITGTSVQGSVTYYTLNTSFSETLEGFYSVHTNQEWGLLLFDYIRAFHRHKPFNSNINRRNATIVNASWGLVAEIQKSSITELNYRGTSINVTDPFLTSQDIQDQYGLMRLDEDTFILQVDYAPMRADLNDAEEDGIIFVVAAGNDNAKIASEFDDDYNNYIVASSRTYYYHRGDFFSVLTNAPTLGGSILVGATGADSQLKKASFSNAGPRIDVFAPGENITGMLADTPEIANVLGWSSSGNMVTFKVTPEVTPSWEGAEAQISVTDYEAVSGTFPIESVSSSSGSGVPDQFTCMITIGDSAFVEATGYVYFNYSHRGISPLDPREGLLDGFREYKRSVDGTSFAAPQVTGYLACLLSENPRMNEVDARIELYEYASFGRMVEYSGSSEYSEAYSLKGGTNFVLAHYFNRRKTTGQVYPRAIQNRTRVYLSAFIQDNFSYQVYPRPKIYRY